jgi:hypothetical protein
LKKQNIHQVLATLGYGDAIGHEVLGIRRVLRKAGFQSDIFVQTADPRLEDETRDYRDLIRKATRRTSDSPLSIGSRASRITYALPDRQILVYHNITPPEFFVDVHEQLVEQCFKGRRELGIYPARVDLALGDSEFNRQELETLGFDPTGVLPVVPDFSHLDLPANDLIAREFDDAWTNILFVGRIIPNKRIENVIRYFHAYQRHFNPRSRLLLVGSWLLRVPGALHQLRAPRVATFISGHVSTELSCTTSPISSCASARFSPLSSRSQTDPVLAYAAAVPTTMVGGVLYSTEEPLEVAALPTPSWTTRPAADRQKDQAGTAAHVSTAPCWFVHQVLKAPQAGAPMRRTSGINSGSLKSCSNTSSIVSDLAVCPGRSKPASSRKSADASTSRCRHWGDAIGDPAACAGCCARWARSKSSR